MITSGYAMWFTAAPKPLKASFLGSPSPQGSHSPYILGDTTRPGHVTYVLVWSKSDQRWLRKTLHKQTDKQTNRQTDRHYENNVHLAVNQFNTQFGDLHLARTTDLSDLHAQFPELVNVIKLLSSVPHILSQYSDDVALQTVHWITRFSQWEFSSLI